MGRCSDYNSGQVPHCLRVFVTAPLEERSRRAREEYGVESVHIENYVTRQDRYRASYYNHFVGKKWGDMNNYDLCINSRIGIEESSGPFRPPRWPWMRTAGKTAGAARRHLVSGPPFCSRTG